MVHCISSSEPDSADLNIPSSEHEWQRNHQMGNTSKSDYTDVTSAQNYFTKKSSPTHITFAESSNSVSGSQYMTDQMKQDAVVSSRNYEKMMQQKRRSSTETLMVVETHHMHSSLFEDDEGMCITLYWLHVHFIFCYCMIRMT